MAKKTNPFDRIKQAAAGVAMPDASFAIPPASYAGPVDLWQIVIIGLIDTRQHYPHWYRLIDCISDDELSAALKSLINITLPSTPGMPDQTNLLQFDVGSFAIVVNADKWIIQTASEENTGRMLDVASKVFARLNEIVISAYGINKHWAAKVETGRAGRFLADQLQSTTLPLPSGDADAQFSYNLHAKHHDVAIQMAQSPIGPSWLGIIYNCHHTIKSKTPVQKLGYYDLGEFLRADADVDWKSAASYAKELVAFIAQKKGE